MTEGYNGWKNRATWAFVLWMDNEEGSYRSMIELAEPFIGDTTEDDDVSGCADAMEADARQTLDPAEYVENFGDISLSDWLKGPGMVVSDIGDIDEIDWREVAEHYLSTVRENQR